MRTHSTLTVLALLFTVLSLSAQERQVSFDTKGKVLEIKSGSPYAALWRSEVDAFERLLAFEADSVVVLEIYRIADGVWVRTRKNIDRPRFTAKQLQLDSLADVVQKQGGELSEEDIEDLRTTFTYDQTGFSSLHGITASVLTESGSMFWIVAGGSYFVISLLSDNMNVTRANVEAAKYGHLTGLLQGFMAAGVAETEEKATFALASAGGIAHAIISYKGMTGTDAEPTEQYLRMTAERHSLVWGWGLALVALGEDSRLTSLAGASLALSLSSNLWSRPAFGLDSRRMSWGDALLADEFMTPWYVSLLALSISLELDKASQLGLMMSVGGVSGYLVGMNINEGRMRSLGTVKRTRLLTYGGALLGLGIIGGVEPEPKAEMWILSGTTWLGYVIGARFGSPEPSSGWDLRVMPENLLLGELQRPTPGRLFVHPVPVAVLSVSL